MRSNSWLMVCATFAIVFALVSETSAQSSNLQIKGPRDSQEQFSGATYGPIDAADTLWGIASRYRQNKSLTIYQVMVATYELNPGAFEQQNLNLLIDGAILRLPSERYIARIDPEEAQLRAEQDDRALSNQSPSSKAPEKTNIKPPTELVRKSDLNDSQNQIKQQINRLDEQQLQQFELLRQQFAASIDNVQSLIDENRKVFERLDSVNSDIVDLRSQLDERVKPQMDQQVAMQQELLELIKTAEAREQEKLASSWTHYLTNPLTLIIGSALLMLMLVGSVVMWLLKRNRSQANSEPISNQAPIASAPMATQPQVDDLSDSLVEDLAIPDADDDLFNDDELLDDVLSEELEESLDDAVESELENYADLSDEMLVPDVDDDDSDSLFEDDDDELLKELDDVDMDELDSIDLSDDIDLSDPIDDELDEELINELESSTELEDDSLDDLFDEDDLTEIDSDLANELTSDDDLDAILDAEPDSSESSLAAPAIEPDEKPEISIDDLLDDASNDKATPPNVDIDVETGVSNQMLTQLEDEVASQNAELDKATDDILNELEQLEMMKGMMGDDDFDDYDDDEEPESISEAQQEDIQSLDDFASDLDDIDIDEMGELDDPLSEDLLSELGATGDLEDIIADDTDALADELLAELGADVIDDEPAETKISEAADIDDADINDDDINDELTDELLAELGLEDEQDDVIEEAKTSEAADIDDADINDDDINDELTDDLLAELGLEDEQDDAVEEARTSKAADIDDADINDDINDELTDELLAELDDIPSFAVDDDEQEEFSIDDDFDDSLVDAALDEFDVEDEADTFKGNDSTEASNNDDVDELSDLPGLGDWLGKDDSEDSVVLEEIEGADFDDLLQSIDSESEPELKLDNPDLDLDALFTDPDATESEDESTDFVDVDTLLEESAADDGSRAEETNLNLDVALSEFSGIGEDDVSVDVDVGGAQAANLDLAQAYIEMDDKEAAIELLNEVINDGTDEQQQEAKSILDSLT